MEMYEQMTLFDLLPARPGDYVESHGPAICHIMRPGYIGRMVVYDCSTAGHAWFRAGILEKYFKREDCWRSVINVGRRDRILLDHRAGRDIYEMTEARP